MPKLDNGTFPNEEPQHVEDRRKSARLPFMGLRLKVRKRNFPRSAKFQECYSIDLSNSGLAFTSNTLKLSEMEKVDFILTFQNQVIQGTALVRYVRGSAEFNQYGLMFLQSLPELDTVLGGENLTTQEIKHLAGSMAEHVAYSIQELQDRKLRITRQQQRFFDALSAYFERLSEMGIRLPAAHSPTTNWTEAHHAVVLDNLNNCVDFVRYSVDRDEMTEESIHLVQAGDNENIFYETKTGEIFHNLFELLNYISDEISLVAKLAHLYPQVRADGRTET